MDVVAWAPVVSGGVAVVAAVGSVIGWVQARSERSAAAEQAKIATDAQKGASQALQQIASLQTHQSEQQRIRASAAERDPWQLRKIPGTQTEAEIFNDTGTAKHQVSVKIFANDQLWQEQTIPYVGPKRSARIPYIDLNAEMKAVITWHLNEDSSDEQPPQIIVW